MILKKSETHFFRQDIYAHDVVIKNSLISCPCTFWLSKEERVVFLFRETTGGVVIQNELYSTS